MKNSTKKVLQALISLVLGIVILYFVFKSTGTDIKDNIKAFKTVNPFWLVITCICYMLTNISRTYRWQMLFEPLGYKPGWLNTFFSIMLGYLANLGIPRSGEILRPATLTQYEGIPIEKAMGTLITDRILDFVCLFIVIAIGLILHFNLLINELGKLISLDSLKGKIILGGVALVGFLAVFILYRMIRQNNQSPFIQKIIKMMDGFKDGLLSIKNVKNIPLFIFHTFIIWFLYFMMTYLCFKGFEPTAGITMSQSLVVFIFGAFGMIMPTPGGMGTYQFALKEGLALFGVNQASGVVMGNILYFTINIFCNVFFGVLAIIFLPIINRQRNIQPNKI